MKRTLLILVSLLLLVSCSDKDIEATTYKEIITNNAVEIDGIAYHIEAVTTEIMTYNKNDRVIKNESTYEYFKSNSDYSTKGSDSNFEYSYEGDLSVKCQQYLDGTLHSTAYYTYDNNRVVEVKQVYEDGSEIMLKYSYGDGFIKISNTNNLGEITSILTLYVDKNDRIMKSDTEQNDTITTTYYEYNNIGDKIVSYSVTPGDIYYMAVDFYDYDYNEDMLPLIITTSRVYSPIDKENIRQY